MADAIALALENNLDMEVERGGFLRGLSLLADEPPPGIGGPSSPLLTNLTASL